MSKENQKTENPVQALAAFAAERMEKMRKSIRVLVALCEATPQCHTPEFLRAIVEAKNAIKAFPTRVKE